MKNASKVLRISLALLLISMPAFSQLNLGRISGTVTDSSGSWYPAPRSRSRTWTAACREI